MAITHLGDPFTDFQNQQDAQFRREADALARQAQQSHADARADIEKQFSGLVGTTKTFAIVSGTIVAVGTAIGAYHGWARTRSVGWTLGWALFGAILPIVAVPVALAQGIGKRQNPSRRRRLKRSKKGKKARR